MTRQSQSQRKAENTKRKTKTRKKHLLMLLSKTVKRRRKRSERTDPLKSQRKKRRNVDALRRNSMIQIRYVVVVTSLSTDLQHDNVDDVHSPNHHHPGAVGDKENLQWNDALMADILTFPSSAIPTSLKIAPLESTIAPLDTTKSPSPQNIFSGYQRPMVDNIVSKFPPEPFARQTSSLAPPKLPVAHVAPLAPRRAPVRDSRDILAFPSLSNPFDFGILDSTQTLPLQERSEGI